MSRKDEEPGFAGRWSRLKHEARSREPAEEAMAVREDGPHTGAAEQSDEEVLARLGLPDPDSLKPGDDFARFMSRAVPARLRNRALRKLWLSNPVLSAVDDMVDYGEDYTDAATVIENLQTAYQVGRGWADKIVETPKPPAARKREEPEAEPEREPERESRDPESDAAGSEPESATPDDPAAAESAENPDLAPNTAPQPPAEPAVSTRRRMRFRVAED